MQKELYLFISACSDDCLWRMSCGLLYTHFLRRMRWGGRGKKGCKKHFMPLLWRWSFKIYASLLIFSFIDISLHEDKRALSLFCYKKYFWSKMNVKTPIDCPTFILYQSTFYDKMDVTLFELGGSGFYPLFETFFSLVNQYFVTVAKIYLAT